MNIVQPSITAPWTDAASRIVIIFNATAGYHPEYEGYVLGMEIKQADTILLGFPFEFVHDTFNASTRAADLNAYIAVTDKGGPAVSSMVVIYQYIMERGERGKQERMEDWQ